MLLSSRVSLFSYRPIPHGSDPERRCFPLSQLARPLNALDEIVMLIEANIKAKNQRDLSALGCGVLPLASEFCFRIGGCHVIGCNNGVHR